MSKHDTPTDDLSNAAEKIDEVIASSTEESQEPVLQYVIDYDDVEDTDEDAEITDIASTEQTVEISALSKATEINMPCEDSHTEPSHEAQDTATESDITATTVASSLDHSFDAASETVDNSVFRAYPMFSMKDVAVVDKKTGEHIWDHLNMHCEAGHSYSVLLDSDATRQHDTLLALMAGFSYPNEGEVMTKSTRFEELEPLELRGHRIGVLLEQFALRNNLSAAANLEYVMQASNRNYLKPIRVVAQDLLTQVGFAVDDDDAADSEAQHKRTKTLVRDLDPVEAHQVMIARTIATDPDIVIADEPTVNLNDVDAAEFLTLLRNQIHTESKERTIIVLTSNPQVAEQMEFTIDLR